MIELQARISNAMSCYVMRHFSQFRTLRYIVVFYSTLQYKEDANFKCKLEISAVIFVHELTLYIIVQYFYPQKIAHIFLITSIFKKLTQNWF